VFAEARRALIVGINDYREITPLQKAVGDAEALKVTLERLGSVSILCSTPTEENSIAQSQPSKPRSIQATPRSFISRATVWKSMVKTTYSLPTFLNRNRASRTSSNRRQ